MVEYTIQKTNVHPCSITADDYNKFLENVCTNNPNIITGE